MMEVYQNIKKYRKMNGWTQEELATKVGYTSRATISKIERGGQDLNQSAIVAFAKAFGISVDELLGADGGITHPDQLTPEEQRLIAYYRKLSELEKDMVFRSLGQKREQ